MSRTRLVGAAGLACGPVLLRGGAAAWSAGEGGRGRAPEGRRRPPTFSCVMMPARASSSKSAPEHDSAEGHRPGCGDVSGAGLIGSRRRSTPARRRPARRACAYLPTAARGRGWSCGRTFAAAAAESTAGRPGRRGGGAEARFRVSGSAGPRVSGSAGQRVSGSAVGECHADSGAKGDDAGCCVTATLWRRRPFFPPLSPLLFDRGPLVRDGEGGEWEGGSAQPKKSAHEKKGRARRQPRGEREGGHDKQALCKPSRRLCSLSAALRPDTAAEAKR